MSPGLLEELSKRRVRGGGITTGVTTVFNIFTGPDQLRADFVVCFIGIILFLLLFGAAITNTRKLVGRERTPAALLLVATACFAIYYGMIFANYSNGPFVYDTFSPEAENAVGRVGFQFNYTGIALMLCALLFFNNCTFEFGQPSNHLIGLPSRMWAMIIVGVFYFFATMENILAGTLLVAEENGARGAALLAQDRATNGFFILYRMIMVGISIFLFYCCFVRPKGGPADKFHGILRNVIAPILILGTIVSLCLAIADAALFEQVEAAIKARNRFTNIDGLEITRLNVELGDRITQALTNFLVILITLSACSSLWSGKNRAIPQQPMMQGGYPQQQGFVPQQQQGYAPYPQQPYQQQPYPQQPYQQQPYQQQPYQQQPYQQQPFQNNNAPYQTSNASSTPPPPGIGYNGYNPHQQQHPQQQQHSPYAAQPGLPYQPQTSPSSPVTVDSK